MKNVLFSILIGFCIILGSISGQAKTYKIVEHISSEHSVHTKSHSHKHHHHDHHGHSEKKSSRSHDHQHSVELSYSTISLALPSYDGLVSHALTVTQILRAYYSLEILNQLSFSPPVFRPPIS